MSPEKALEKIQKFSRDHKRMPSYAEAAILFKLSSKDSAYRIIGKLIEQGFLEKDNAGKIIPKNIDRKLKILGLVEAGFPTPTEENLLDSTTLDSYMIENPDASFMLRVKGDSMIEAGICDGDFVIVERGLEAKIGDIVIAEVDGSWTMKYLRKTNNTFYLEPANKNYSPIYPKESFSISAVVKGVVRKYE